MASTAATNLSFLYFLQEDSETAEKYAELAKETDSYNAAAFVNLVRMEGENSNSICTSSLNAIIGVFLLGQLFVP